jgi:SAM-dependent methyltransferase
MYILMMLTSDPVELKEKLDFVLLFFVVHEVPDKQQLFKDIYSMLKSGGKILFVEPKGHVKPMDFEKTVQFAKAAGFTVPVEKPIKNGLSAFLVKG